MKERPILFSAPMVRTILDGRKTQTRRVVKLAGTYDAESFFTQNERRGIMLWTPAHEKVFASREAFADWTRKTYPDSQWNYCPYGQPGDRLWVRETWGVAPGYNGHRPGDLYPRAMKVGYAADDGLRGCKTRSSIHMPRWASRITLEITAVRVERLQDISEADALAEGVHAASWEYDNGEAAVTAREAYQCLWDLINGSGSWDANPWVWVIEFKRVQE